MARFGVLLRMIGEFGAFQKCLVLLFCIPSFFTLFHMSGQIFMSLEVPHYCNTNWIQAISPNLTFQEELNLAIPRTMEDSLAECSRFTPVDLDLASILKYGLNSIQDCEEGRVYPTMKAPTLVTEHWKSNVHSGCPVHHGLLRHSSQSGPPFLYLHYSEVHRGNSSGWDPPQCCNLEVFPNSVQWLITKKRMREAKYVLLRAAAINKKIISEDVIDWLALEEKAPPRCILDIFKKLYLRNMSLIMAWIWFVDSLVYYEVSLHVGDFGLDIYLTQLIFGAVEIPSRILSIFLHQWIGRGKCQSTWLILGGIVCVMICVTPEDKSALACVPRLLALRASSCPCSARWPDTTLLFLCSPVEVRPYMWESCAFSFRRQATRIFRMQPLSMKLHQSGKSWRFTNWKP